MHLEFLGFRVEEDQDDEQELFAQKDGSRTMCRVWTSGVRITKFYSTSNYAQHNRKELMEFCNTINMEGIAKYFTNEDGSALGVNMYMYIPYDRIAFGNFIDLFFKELDQIIDRPQAKILFG